MSIQQVNLGVEPTGVGGDNYRQAHTKINANFVEISTLVNQLDIDSTTQFTAITDISNALSTKAATTYVDAKNGLQDNAIAANTTDITAIKLKNTAQDTAITALQDKDNAQDTAISSRALTTDVNAKNGLQDNAISSNTTNIGALTTTVGTHSTDIANLKITAGGETVLVPRTISITGAATWTVTFDGTSNVSAAMTIRAATTSVAGIVQLNNTVNSTSITQAATANAVKLANDKATAAIATTQKGVANGVAGLDANGKVPEAQLPPLPSADALNKVRILALAGL